MRPQVDLLRVTLRHEGDGVVARLDGEIDLATAPHVQRRLEPVLDEHDGLEVDLGGLTFMDSAGLHLLEALAARARARGHRFEVRGATGGVARLLALAN